MADSDGQPPNTQDPGYIVPPPAKPLAPAPRVNPPNINSPKEAPPAGGPPGFGDFLEWMRTQVAGGDAPVSPTQRGPLPKERKKFQRVDADAKPAGPAGTEPAASELSVEDAPVSAAPPRRVADGPAETAVSPAATGPAFVLEAPAARVRRQQTPLKRNSWLGLATQLGTLVLLVGSFILGRFSVSKTTAPLAAPAAPVVVNGDGKVTTKLLSDVNATLIDQAMAAEQSRDFKTAADLLGKVKASGDHIPGLTFQLAQLAAFQGDYTKAVPLLNASLAEGENPADVYNMRATLSSRTGIGRGTAMNDYETATKVDPFTARNFFYWGEALRRAGKDQAAIARLKQAVDRLREPELESSYRMKLRLAQIEAGQEKEFADELAKELARPNPEMDWLITAAAQEIHSGNFAAAAGYLDRAAQRGDAETFASRLRDYYLFQFKYEKELTRFYAKAPAARPGSSENSPAPTDSPAAEAAMPPAIGLEVPDLPPPASPGATVPAKQ